MEADLNKAYDPKLVEETIYDFWIQNNLFYIDEDTQNPKRYSIVIPPPNVTGFLHIGHALNATLQDILCRYKRLKGFDVLWIAGTDHAGIACQNVVEKEIAKENLTRHDLGREDFIKRVWQWKEKSGGTIINQFKKLGASCDWTKERFTLDNELSEAVKEVFLKLYNENLIYRGDYIVNWCTRCHTALSDLEVEHYEKQSFLYHIKYFFPDKKQFLVVATTRPETMFADSALAINPNDERYKNLKETSVLIPLSNKEIPIIHDEYVDIEFGTGALKVTPGHDVNDAVLGHRHDLKTVKAFDESGNMTDIAGEFEGLQISDARDKIVEKLDKEGLLLKKEEHTHKVGHCYRCRTVIEPYVSKQWFVKIKPLAEKAIKAVENEDIKIIPKSWEKTYFSWMLNIKDWCISRQIWWGHRIPAYYCTSCGELVVSKETPLHCPKCSNTDFTLETDVLDTWFSSALWPFSTMGWPKKTKLLEKFYPTNVLVSAFDIIFFWVARMIMAGLHFTDKVPFSEVYIHALILDKKGEKMSKTKGNTIDPLEMIDKYGADALRLCLSAFAAQGRNIKMDEKRIEGYMWFTNKLWNAAKFVSLHIEDDSASDDFDVKKLSLTNKWILSSLTSSAQKIEEALDAYKFNEAVAEIYQFVWHKFCDWYIEAIKPALFDKEKADEKEDAKKLVKFVFKNILILLHPFAPFITEEIWLKLFGRSSILKEEYPKLNFYDKTAEKDFDFLMQIVSGIRNIKQEMNINAAKKIDIKIISSNVEEQNIISCNNSFLTNLANLHSVEIKQENEDEMLFIPFVVNDATVHVIVEDVIDLESERDRINKQIKKISSELALIEKKLNNKNFLDKAPKEVVKKEKEKEKELKEKVLKLEENLKLIS